MLYIGMVVAYVNTVLLFPNIIGDDGFGFYNLIITISVLYSLAASLGVPSIIAKYFPFYRTDDRRHTGFIHWAALLAFAGFAAATVLYIIFKPVIVSAYIENSPLLIKYYYFMIPLTAFVVIFNFLEMTGRVIYKTMYSNFLQFVLLRLATTAMLLLVQQGWLTFDGFIMGYIVSNGIISLLLLISLAFSGNFSYRFHREGAKTIQRKQIINFGLYTMISSSVYVLLQKVDTLMLSAMAGDGVQGVYSWYFSIALVISVPAQALSRTTYAIVADAWSRHDMANIKQVYTKTSIIQMVAGVLLFVGIFVNRENLYALARNKDFTDPQYFTLFVVIGLGFLADITGGLNTYIITTSHKYRLMTALIILASIFCITLNYFLIPVYAGLGAAIAYFLTIAGINFCCWLYIKIRFKMQPFTVKHMLVIVIGVITYLVGKYFWHLPNVWLDIAVRSSITGLVYLGLTYFFKISADVNEKVDEVFARFLSKKT